MPDPRRRCLIVQAEPRHEETLPSMVDAALRAGYRPTVVMSVRSLRRRGDIFTAVPGLDVEIIYDDFGDHGSEERGLGRLNALARESAFVLMNSFNRRWSVEWSMALSGPVLLVLHNVDDFLANPAHKLAMDNPKVQLITLAPHVMTEVIARIGKAQMDRVDVVEPCLWTAGEPEPKPGLPRRVALPGAVSRRTRDYPGLLQAISENPQAFDGHRFVIGSGGGDRAWIETEVQERGLSPWFEFLPITGGDVSQDAYIASLAACQVMLSLIPADFEKYQRVKITSAVPSSVGFAVPLIMDRWSAACYRAPLLATDHGTRASLDRLLSLSEADLQDHRAALITYRRERLAQNGQALERLAARAEKA